MADARAAISNLLGVGSADLSSRANRIRVERSHLKREAARLREEAKQEAKQRKRYREAAARCSVGELIDVIVCKKTAEDAKGGAGKADAKGAIELR